MDESRQAERGFTLVELMIVVAIIGVLSVLAVVGYRRLLNSSHVSEATHMIQSIRVAQEAYHAETGSYAAISKSLDDTICPAITAGQRSTWDPTCDGGNGLKWSTLPIHADGTFSFQFATTTGLAGTMPSPPTNFQHPPSFGSTAPTTDWFAITARGDVDGNGVYCGVATTSWNSAVYVDNEGE